MLSRWTALQHLRAPGYVRFHGGPLDGKRRWFELLVERDGRPHRRLARVDVRAGLRSVYVMRDNLPNDGVWEFIFNGTEVIDGSNVEHTSP